MATWNLEDGLKLVRAIQQDCKKYGYHVTLGGGVLNDGVGRKDIDLYFLPMGNSMGKTEPQKLLQWLTNMWGPSKSIANYASEETNTSVGQISIGGYGSQLVSSSFTGWYVSASASSPLSPPLPEPSVGTIYRYKEKFFRSTSKDRIDVFIL